ncbi:MAG: M48 family metalloprotease [PVC group bacterium]|nr:M48 family metalloprotease [PVC group bacterium]
MATQEEEIYFYSTEKEVKIGKSVSRQAERQFKVEADALVQKRINDIGQKLALVCDRREIKYYFKVLEKDDVNAFALPGGYIYIFKGLWDKIEKEDDLIAAVLAHEIGHLCARHNIKRLQQSMGYGVLTVLVNTASGMDGYSRRKATVGINELLLSYSRRDELQSDRLAVSYLQKAGYNSLKIIELLEILQKESRDKPVGPLHVLTHPYITERMRAVRELIKGGNIEFDDYINS